VGSVDSGVPAVVLQVLPRAAIWDVLDQHLELRLPARRASATAATVASAAAAAAVCASWAFYSEATAAKPVPVPSVDGIVGITRVGKLEKGKRWSATATLDRNVSNPAVLVEKIVNLFLADVVWQVADVDPAAVCNLAPSVAAAAAASVIPVVPSVIVVS